MITVTIINHLMIIAILAFAVIGVLIKKDTKNGLKKKITENMDSNIPYYPYLQAKNILQLM